MKSDFGTLPTGETASLYTVRDGGLTARISDFGATLVSLLVPDAQGNVADVVLGFDSPQGYADSACYLGATVGRNANRIKGAAFELSGKTHHLTPNENGNSLHSGPDCFHLRLWKVKKHTENTIVLTLDSPNGDQGFPGHAEISVTYTLEMGALRILYEGICDKDTVFNLTNHSYFNLAGHRNTALAMEQLLTLPGRFFNAADENSIPTGELRSVEGTPMDFRTPKAIGRDIREDYDALNLQGGFDHNWEVYCAPCAILQDPHSGRQMAVYTDCPGVQFYAGNYLRDEVGKEGVVYCKRSGICLETQFYPDAVNHPEWPQPFTKAGERYRSETEYRFSNT